jgi:nitrite reductase (NAD(P)H)
MVSAVDQKKDASTSIVIVGLGMVGLSFIEKILEYDTAKKYTITAICEEPLGKPIQPLQDL